MSVLTKVLVVLLAVMSIALCMFVVATFAQQQNWKASAEDWQQAALAAQAKERAATANAALERARSLDQHKRDTGEMSKLRLELADANGRVSELERQFADTSSKLGIEQGQVTSAQDSIKLIQASLNREKEFAAKISRRNSELERANIDLTDRVKELTTSVEMARTQIRALKQQLGGEDVTYSAPSSSSSGLAPATQIPGGSAIVEANLPMVQPVGSSSNAAPIRGQVTSVRENLASISVGSADGVAPGMTFLLYRRSGAGGKPQYLGTLKVTRVEANESAGPIVQSEGNIQAGDLARDEASFAMRG